MNFPKIEVLIFLWISVVSTGTVFYPAGVDAQEAFVRDVSISESDRDLLVSFRVEGCFPDKIEEAINNGVNTTFVFLIELNRIKRFWWDNEVAEVEITHKLYYDNLKKLYQVTLEEQKGDTLSVKTFGKAKELMSEVKAVEVVRLDRLRKGQDYEIRIKAEMDRIELPFNLDYVFFFLSLWDFETKWTSMRFEH